MRLEIPAFVAVLAAAMYLMLLGVGALAYPARTTHFLGGLAQTLRVHVMELAVRIVVGGALVVSAPRMLFGPAFAIGGWVLVGTTLVMAVIPWRLHRRFANWSVPQATRHMPLLGVSAVIGGLVLLGAVVIPRAGG